MPLRLLFVSSEVAPWVKTGGLGDVSAALPEALHRIGVDVRLLVPAYSKFKAAFPDAKPLVGIAQPGGDLPACRILEAVTPGGVPLWLLDCPDYFDRPGGPYQAPGGADWPDNPLRFALLAKVAAILSSNASPLDWRPQVVNAHDWQAALIPAYLRFLPGPRPATVTTIHNLAFQGNFSPDWLAPVGLPPAAFSPEGAEFYGHLSYLKAGLYYADRVTTVSPTYADEIRGDELGFGMAGLLRHRGGAVSGILNGIDGEVWNPATDPLIAQHYDADHLEAKAGNKAALRARFDLADIPSAPLLGVVSRLTHQKGHDWLLTILPQLAAEGVQLALLGSGESELEKGFAAAAQAYPGMVGVKIGYDESLAHLIEAGSDLFVMPSRFEPCGLNQMYSLRYGTPPVVRPTGGLADTVVDCNEATLAAGRANGFVMPGVDAESLLATLQRAVAAWRQPELWRQIQRNGMAIDFGWETAAQAYLKLYEEIA